VAQLQISRDPRLKYIIYEGQITVKGDITKWKPYAGANPHRHHAHISVHGDYDSRKDWQIAGQIQPIDTPTYTVKPGDTLNKIASLKQISPQRLVTLNKLADPNKLTVGQILKLA
jgi:hypothetical protein